MLKVYYLFFEEGEIAPTMIVFVFPVKDSWRSRVSLDYLNMAVFFEGSFDKELMTLPRVVKDKLMFFSSYRWSFVIAYLLFIFSDPAKSHKFNLALYIDNFLL